MFCLRCFLKFGLTRKKAPGKGLSSGDVHFGPSLRAFWMICSFFFLRFLSKSKFWCDFLFGDVMCRSCSSVVFLIVVVLGNRFFGFMKKLMISGVL